MKKAESQTLEPVKVRLKRFDYASGFHEACDQITAWINALGTSNYSVKQLRKELNLKILEMDPYGSKDFIRK